jgi:subfamily B ATP-binding cassette protein MsbA
MVIQNLLTVLARSVNDIFQIVFGVAVMFWVQFRLALLTFLILPVLSMAVRRFSNRLRAIGSQMQARLGDIATATHESVMGMKEIQSFGMEELTIDRFSRINEDNYRVNMKATKYGALTQPVVELFHAFGIGLVIWYGSVFVIDRTITPGQLMEFLACLGMIFHPIKTLTDVHNFLRQSEGAAERIFELLDHPVEIVSKPGAATISRVTGSVRYDRVSFWYEDPDRPVVRDFELEVEPGQVVALVGHSGAGKSTLVNLLPRFYDVREGRITIDGQDIRAVDLASLRSHIGLVPQETILFAGTIGDNIRFGRQEATPDEIRRAAADANALDFVLRLARGLDTQIGERGVKLSGGEKQRIAIARAILKDPRILILDEATSSLDTESERLVQEAIDRLMASRTTFVIAHRLSTVVHADKIIVLEDGRVMEIGTHAQLFEKRGLYHRLCRAQFKAA